MLDKILEEYRRIWALNYASSLLGWDLETYMPEDDSQLRGEAIANISTVVRELTLSLADKLDKVRDEDLDDFGRGVVRVLRRSVRFYRAVPREITEELTWPHSLQWCGEKREGDPTLSPSSPT